MSRGTRTDRAVNVLGDGFVRWLVLTADSQPDVAFIPLYQPAVSFHRGRQVEEHHCREHQKGNKGGEQKGRTESFGHG